MNENHLFKESLKFSAILPTENETDTRIYGRICYSHKIENMEIVWDATIRQYDDVRKDKNKREDSTGQPAQCKP